MIKLIVLGATGSIGTTCLNAIRDKKLNAKVVALVAHSSIDKLNELKDEFNCKTFINDGKSSLDEFLSSLDADIVLNGISGAKGLEASILSLKNGYDLALANKESVVMGGDYFLSLANKLGRKIIPVDSEHSAIYHLIKGYNDLDSVVITASGGPFYKKNNLENVSVEDAINHPTWRMGKKISIDSATLANKGLEVIEAGFLFNLSADKIEVVIHRQSIVHSMIRMKNGAVYAQLSPPDMTLPIVSAINDDKFKLNDVVSPLSFKDLTLTFKEVENNEFPLLHLAYEALKCKGSYPIAFNAANEVAVNLFIQNRIKFTEISNITSKVLEHDFSHTSNSFEEIIYHDKKARYLALKGF